MARPREIDREQLLERFLQYIDRTDIPIVAEFAVLQGLYRQQLYEIDELSDAIKQCTSKKEASLERKGLAGEVNCTMAIFSLKQLGWKDVQRQELSGPDGGPIETKNADALSDIELQSIARAGRAAPTEPEAGAD
jgi:hypothetical protein